MNSGNLDISRLLIFVVGTSGSGKDSVIRETVAYLTKNGVPAQIMKRMITRKPDENEKSNYLPVDEFLSRKSEFAIAWKIYGNWYGIPWDSLSIAYENHSLLLINVSRGVLYEARKLFPSSLIILVTVPKKTAESRIKKRGRENNEGIQMRLSRMTSKIDMPPPNRIIANTGDLKDSAIELGDYLIEHYCKEK